MKNITIILFVCISLSLSAQKRKSEELSFKSTPRVNYFIGNSQVSYDDFIAKLNNYDKSIKNKFITGENLSGTGTAIGGLGAVCIGWDLGARIVGGKGCDALLVSGSGILAGGVILHLIGRNQMQKALTLYNNNSASLFLNTTPTGLGLCLNF